MASIGESIGKPTRRFLLTSTADSIAIRPTCRTLENRSSAWNMFGKFSCCRQLVRRKQLQRGSATLQLLFSLQAVDSTKACQKCLRSCSSSEDQRVGLAGLVEHCPLCLPKERFTHAVPCACWNATLRSLKHRHANLPMQTCQIMTERHAQTFI